MSTISKPPLNDFNAWACFWYYIIGMNVIPMVTRHKTGKKGYDWKDGKNKPVPEEKFKEWLNEGAFKDGMGVILGYVWRGKYEGKYLILIDLDNLLAIEEFCTMNENTVLSLKDQISKRFIVEQHKDNTDKAHVLFYCNVPFVDKSNDAGIIKDYKDKVRNNLVPGFEVKGTSQAGVVFCTPSIHQDGEHYDIIGTMIPTEIMDKETAEGTMQRLNNICKKYGLPYLDKVKTDANGNTTVALAPINDIYNLDNKTTEGNNRHMRELRLMDSLILKLRDRMKLEQIKLVAKTMTSITNIPPKPEEEFEKDWESSVKYVQDLDAQKTREKLIEGCEVMELINHCPEKYIAVIRNDKFYNATLGIIQQIRAVQEIIIEYKKEKEKDDKGKVISTTVTAVPHHTQIILNAAPMMPIEILKDPLFGGTKYRLQFEYVGSSSSSDSNNNTTDHHQHSRIFSSDVIGPYTKEELKDYLIKQTSWVYKQKYVDDALSQVFKAYETREAMGFCVVKEEIGPAGFFYYNNKIVASKLNLKPPTPSNVAQGIVTLLEMQKRFFNTKRDRSRFSYYYKLHSVSPFDYVRKQMKLVHRYGWIKRGDLSGAGGSSKSELAGRLPCYMWRLDENTHILPKRDVDSDARISETLASTTMPLAFEEPDFLAPKRMKKSSTESILSTLKNTVDVMEGYRLTHKRERIREPYLAYFSLTHNSPPILEEGTTRRLQPDIYEDKDKKDVLGNEAVIDAYRAFIEDNKEKLAYHGDFIAYYVTNNIDVLRNNWLSTAKKILEAMFEYADFSQIKEKNKSEDPDIKVVIESKKCPDWLMNEVIEDSTTGGSGISDEDIKAQKRDLIRSAFLNFVMYHSNKYSNDMRMSDEMIIGKPSTTEAIKWLAQNHILPGVNYHSMYGICVSSSIIHTLEDYGGLDPDEGIKFVDLEHLCGFKPGWSKEKVDGKLKNIRIEHIKLTEFANFIAPDSLEVTSDELLATNQQLP